MRKKYLDHVRWILIFLLIPYHAAMAWNVWGEPNYIYFEGNKVISSIVVFLSPYYMPLMFLIAGISTKCALEKRTVRQYVGERVKKLLIPFVLGVGLLMPPMTYLAEVFHQDYSDGFLQHYTIFFTRFTDLTGADGGFSVGQFWFILYLCIISLIAVGIFGLQRHIAPEACMRTSPGWWIYFLGVPLPLFSMWLSIGGKSLVEYLYLFLLGYYIFSNEAVICKMQAHKGVFLCIGLLATVFHVYMLVWSEAPYPWLSMALKYISEWFMMMALLGMGKRYLNHSGKISTYMSQRSYTFYMFHFVWVVLFQYLLSHVCRNHTVWLYVLPVILSYGATWLCCEICYRTRMVARRIMNVCMNTCIHTWKGM